MSQGDANPQLTKRIDGLKTLAKEQGRTPRQTRDNLNRAAYSILGKPPAGKVGVGQVMKTDKRVFIGLGNSDPKLTYTRHNAGRLFVRKLAQIENAK